MTHYKIPRGNALTDKELNDICAAPRPENPGWDRWEYIGHYLEVFNGTPRWKFMEPGRMKELFTKFLRIEGMSDIMRSRIHIALAEMDDLGK